MRLLLGDCLKEMDNIPGGSVHLVLTDPPYGTTNCKWDSIIPLEPMWKQLKRITKPNAAIVLCSAQPFTTTLISSNMKMFKYCWTWEKSNKTGYPNANRQPMRNIEDIVVFYGKQCRYYPQGLKRINKKIIQHKTKKESIFSGRNDGSLCNDYIQKYTGYPTQLLKFKSENNALIPTAKPVLLMEYLIKSYTRKNQTVLDFSMGSGTTGVACQNLNRNFIGIEKNRQHYRIAKSRLNAFIKE